MFYHLNEEQDQRIKILVIDPNPKNNETWLSLEKPDYCLLSVNSIRDACQYILSQDISIIICSLETKDTECDNITSLEIYAKMYTVPILFVSEPKCIPFR